MKTIRNILRKSVSTILLCTLLLSAVGCQSQTKDVSEKTAKVSDTSIVISDTSVNSNTESSVWTPSRQESVISEVPSEASSEESVDITSDTPSDTSDESSSDTSADISSDTSSDISTVTSDVSQVSESSQSSVFDLPDDFQDNGIFSAYYDDAYRYLSKMTLEEKIGQMIFASKPDYEDTEFAMEYYIGGYILLGNTFVGKSKEDVQNMISSLSNSQKVPLAFAVDEEGGTVTRISAKPQLSSHEFESPRQLYKNGGLAFIQSDADEKASLLKELGLDINFAPVCDISQNKKDFIYDRSLGQDAATTGEFVRIVTEISQSKGVSVTLKHFPGYGGNADTHIGVSVDDRELSEFRKKDFIPFQAGIQAGAHLVMMSHNIVNNIEKDVPCSLSPNAHSILREELGFTGLIITDDLAMGAITKYSGDYTPAVAAVLAGNDILLMSSDLVDASVSSIKSAVESNTIDEKLIDKAVLRILSWKYSKGIM